MTVQGTATPPSIGPNLGPGFGALTGPDSSSSGPGNATPTDGSGGSKLFRLAVAVPFFMGAALYLSVIFAFFSVLPIIYSHIRFGRFGGILSALTNMAIVWAISGRMNAAVFFVLAVVLGTSIAECIKLGLKIEWNAIFSVGMMLFISTLLLLSYSHRFHIDPMAKLDGFIASMVEQVAANVEKYKASGAFSSQDLDKFLVDPEMTKRNILFELPSFVTISLLVVTVGNLLLLLRLNILNIRNWLGLKADFFKQWKAPEHLVWPTLVAGFGVIIDVPVFSDVALNVFKVLMAVYALHGLAITNYLFDIWDLKGFVRPVGYVLAVAILLPLVISLGFFDLWFSFRKKLEVS